jgi:predicted SAM-dependent methyltransferase
MELFCVEDMMSEEIFKIRKDKERAKSIFETAKERYSIINIYPKSKVFKIIEEYYEIIKECIISLMYLEGVKSLSHIKSIEWFSENFKIFSRRQIDLVDNLRRLRNGSLYYGEHANKIFLENNEDEINDLIKILIFFIEKKLK